jgi:hypothetical protein
VVEQESFLLMQAGQMFMVLSLFAVLKLNKYLPLAVIFTAALCFVALAVIVNLLLPYVTNLHEGSDAFLRRWKTAVAKDKYLKRKHAGLRPLRFTAGLPGVTFFAFDKSSQTDFMMGCIDQTINLMIGYPDEYIRKVFLNK